MASKAQNSRDYKAEYLKAKIAKLKVTPARGKRTLDAKIDVVARLMTPRQDTNGSTVRGLSFAQARKQVGLSRGAFAKGVKGRPFFERDKTTGKIVKDKGRNQLALSPYGVIYSDASYRKVSAVGKHGALLAEWSKAVTVAQDGRSSKQDRMQALQQIEELSAKRIYDVYGNRIYLASNLETIEEVQSEMTPEQREEFDDRRQSGKI
jgi:hypothetical protein